MPIGVPRIIYCWGEELPAQWTDIYNFIFRRRMIFLMQYLDDELCNQICGLLINIHMEDRSKELEKKEMDKSGLFKNSTKAASSTSVQRTNTVETLNSKNKKVQKGKLVSSSQNNNSLNNSVYELLTSEEDLAIDENFTLEQYTLQKITMDWLNWNSNFFNYTDLTLDEPYLFYLGEILSKDFTKDSGNLLYKGATEQYALDSAAQLGHGPTLQEKITLEEENQSLKEVHTGPSAEVNSANTVQLYQLLGIFKTMANSSLLADRLSTDSAKNKKFVYLYSSKENLVASTNFRGSISSDLNAKSYKLSVEAKDLAAFVNLAAKSLQSVYSPFRFLANFTYSDFSLNTFLQKFTEPLKSAQKQESLVSGKARSTSSNINKPQNLEVEPILELTHASFKNKTKVFNRQILKKLAKKQLNLNLQTHKNSLDFSKKALSQRTLKRDYRQDGILFQNLELDQKANDLTPKRFSLDVNKKSKNYLFNPAFVKPMNSMGEQSKTLLRAQSNAYGSSKGSTSTLNKINQTSLSKDFSRKQTERTMQEEESKKVFVIINSFGGSVGNGITVHDALQFIKAGSLTLALGVAASASSLVLAGGTIGERYVTEGCHTMIHQPEGGISGQASDIWIDSAEIMKIRLDVAEIYSLSTYRPRHKILRDLDRDFYLTATETVYYGLADEIATNEVLSEIVEMTSKVWDYHESQQQRLLESRESSTSGLDTQTQN